MAERVSTALQAAQIIARHRQHDLEVAAVKMIRQTRKNRTGRLFSDRLNWTDRIDDLGLPKVARDLVVSRASSVDRSAEASERRQHTLVDALCSGTRCSLSRAYKLAKYGKHQPALDQLLLTKGIRDRFRWHAEQGHPLPSKYKDRILAALGIDPIALQEDLELLGLADPPAPPPEPEPPEPLPPRVLGWGRPDERTTLPEGHGWSKRRHSEDIA